MCGFMPEALVITLWINKSCFVTKTESKVVSNSNFLMKQMRAWLTKKKNKKIFQTFWN